MSTELLFIWGGFRKNRAGGGSPSIQATNAFQCESGRSRLLTGHHQPVFAHGEGEAGQVLPLMSHGIEALDAAQHHLVVLPADRHDHFSCPCCRGNGSRGTGGGVSRGTTAFGPYAEALHR